MTNYDWPFGTLPFGLFWSNFDKRYPRTYSGHFSNMPLFRWFKFTLKPAYSIVHGKLGLAIWYTSFWTFWPNLDTRDIETYPRTYSGHFEICHFLAIPGPFEYFSENGWSHKIKVSSMKK